MVSRCPVRTQGGKERRKAAVAERAEEAVHELPIPPRAGEVQVEHGPPVDVPVQPQFGLTLKRARERKGLSIHDLAALTRISARWIAALEQERFEQLPATVFVVGYVRNLARALGVDPADLLTRYRSQRQTQDAALLTAGSGSDRFETAMRQRKYLVFTVLAVVVGLVAMLALFLQRRQG